MRAGVKYLFEKFHFHILPQNLSKLKFFRIQKVPSSKHPHVRDICPNAQHGLMGVRRRSWDHR